MSDEPEVSLQEYRRLDNAARQRDAADLAALRKLEAWAAQTPSGYFFIDSPLGPHFKYVASCFISPSGVVHARGEGATLAEAVGRALGSKPMKRSDDDKLLSALRRLENWRQAGVGRYWQINRDTVFAVTLGYGDDHHVFGDDCDTLAEAVDGVAGSLGTEGG